MKNKFLKLALIFLSIGCLDQGSTKQDVVKEYYNAFDAGNYNKMKVLINDTITITSGDYVTPYSHESFHEFFKWDSIFKTSYEVVGLEEKDNHIVATVASESLRYKFLKNNPLTCQFNIFFNSGKISKIHSGECVGADWSIWERQRDSLVMWITKNHPELDGFIYDMTQDGAQDYLEAIELYEKETDQTVKNMWSAFVESNPKFAEEDMPESWFFHDNEQDANRLAELTRNGNKKASSSLYLWYEEAGANLPKIGTKHIITDFSGQAKAIIEIKKVDTIPFNQISEAYAALDMGTKEQPLKKWRKAHWDFFSKAIQERGQKPTEAMVVVCERFETIWPIRTNP